MDIYKKRIKKYKKRVKMALFVLHKKLYKVVQAVFTGLRPVFGPFLLSLVR